MSGIANANEFFYGSNTGAARMGSQSVSIRNGISFMRDSPYDCELTFRLPDLTIPSISQNYSAAGYTWNSQTPIFWKIEVGVTLYEYPSLVDTRASKLTLPTFPTQSLHLQNYNTGSESSSDAPYAIYMIRVPATTWRVDLNVGAITDNSREGNPPLESSVLGVGYRATVSQDGTASNGFWPAFMSSGTYRSTGSDPLTSVGPMLFDPTPSSCGWRYAVDSQYSIVNDCMFQKGLQGSLNYQMTPNALPQPDLVVMVFVNMASTGCATNSITVSSLSATAHNAIGECLSYMDCIPSDGDHPSESREDLSANGDASLFTNCIAVPQPNPNYANEQSIPYIPSTRCMECNSDNDCGAGQYCHVDAGSVSCIVGGVCDAESNSWYGLCRPIDPKNELLGKQCREIVSAYSGEYYAGSAIGMPLENSDFAPDGGLCSSVRLQTTEEGLTIYRAAAWSGACVQGICMECVPGSYEQNSNSGSYKVCVNGERVMAKDVTPFSVAHNVTAGSIVTLLTIIIFVSVIFLGQLAAAFRRSRLLHGQSEPRLSEYVLCCGLCSNERAGASSRLIPVNNPMNLEAAKAASSNL
jgi:hypothetical protein